MILQDWVSNFVLGSSPLSRGAPTRKNTHHHTQKNCPPEGSQSTHPWKAPHTGHPKWRSSIESFPNTHSPTTPINSPQATAIGTLTHHDIPNRAKPQQLYSLKRAFKQKQTKNNYNNYHEQQ